MLNNYYVYVYLDPRKSEGYKYENFYFENEPFYVGKGKNSRKIIHMWEIKKGVSTNQYKTNKIKKILEENLKPVIHLVAENLTEQEALILEESLIKKIGRKEDGGPLTNICLAGKGAPGWHNPIKGKTFEEIYGKEKAKELKKKLSDKILKQKECPEYHEKRKKAIEKAIKTKKENPNWAVKQAEIMRTNVTPEVVAKRAATLKRKCKEGGCVALVQTMKVRGKCNIGVASNMWKGWYYNPTTDTSYDTTATAATCEKCSKETITNKVKRNEWLLLPEPRGKKILGKYPPKEEFLKLGDIPINIKLWVYPS